MMKKLLIGLLMIAMAVATGGMDSAQAKETFLKMATFLPKDDINLTAW